MIKAVIFDCFGVLYPDTFWAMIHKFVPDWERSPDYYHDIVKRVDGGFLSREDFWNETAAACKISRPELDSEVKRMGAFDMELLTYIATLKTQGYKIGMLSNVGRGFISRMFENLRVDDYFDDLVLSSEVGMIKPDRKIFELSAERLNVEPSECVFTDDREEFCEAARATGMQALLYRTFGKFKHELGPLLAAKN